MCTAIVEGWRVTARSPLQVSSTMSRAAPLLGDLLRLSKRALGLPPPRLRGRTSKPSAHARVVVGVSCCLMSSLGSPPNYVIWPMKQYQKI